MPCLGHLARRARVLQQGFARARLPKRLEERVRLLLLALGVRVRVRVRRVRVRRALPQRGEAVEYPLRRGELGELLSQ